MQRYQRVAGLARAAGVNVGVGVDESIVSRCLRSSRHPTRKSAVHAVPQRWSSAYPSPPSAAAASSSSSSSAAAAPANTIIKFVPTQTSYVVERFGKFHRIMPPGLGVLVPVIDRIAYVHSLKEVPIPITCHSAITQDNVSLDRLDAVLYVRITDPYKASYGVQDPVNAVVQLAQTTMRSEIGGLTLDRMLAERSTLNKHIVEAINVAAADWGIQCLHSITPPSSVVHAMHSQVSAERQKRAYILDSEGRRQAEINLAEGQKAAAILASEATKAEEINSAAGEAEAIRLRASATAEGLALLANSITKNNGMQAVSLQVADKYIDAFRQLAKQSTTVLLPWKGSEPADMVAQAMTMFQTLQQKTTTSSVVPGESEELTRNEEKK